jgi:DNA polymerase-3 subunit gamma/tau
MLGAIDGTAVYRLLDALGNNDGKALLDYADRMLIEGASAAGLLESLASLFHRIAVVQVVPNAADNYEDQAQLREVASGFSPEIIQLYYDIALKGRADLALAPDESMGLSMTLLRLLAFAPKNSTFPPQKAPPPKKPKEHPTPTANLDDHRGADNQSNAENTAPKAISATLAEVSQNAHEALISDKPKTHDTASNDVDAQKDGVAPSDKLPETHAVAPSDKSPAGAEAHPNALPDPKTWIDWVKALTLPAMAMKLAENTELIRVVGNRFFLALPRDKKVLIKRGEANLKKAMNAATGFPVELIFEEVLEVQSSHAAQKAREREAFNQEIKSAFCNDPFVLALNQKGGEIVIDTVMPVSDASFK